MFIILATGLTHKHNTRLERLVRDKPLNLLRKFVNYVRKKFYNIERKGIKFYKIDKKLASDKHASLLCLTHGDKEKSFITLMLQKTLDYSKAQKNLYETCQKSPLLIAISTVDFIPFREGGGLGGFTKMTFF
jgi:hypothetical protein